MPKYCLAKTAVNGEIVIQENSETYSASASALASGTTFRDAAKVATIDSNTAATIAARAVVDNILLDYSYVLSDENITSMINNSLKTTVQPIIPVALKAIASTVDGKNYILNKNTTIRENEYLLIRNGNSLTIDIGRFIFNNYGLIAVGERQDPQTKGCAGCSTTNKAAASSSTTCCASATAASGAVSYTWDLTTAPNPPANYGTITNTLGCVTIGKGVKLVNYGNITNSSCWVLSPGDSTYAGGQIQNSTSIDPPQSGTFKNSALLYSG